MNSLNCKLKCNLHKLKMGIIYFINELASHYWNIWNIYNITFSVLSSISHSRTKLWMQKTKQKTKSKKQLFSSCLGLTSALIIGFLRFLPMLLLVPPGFAVKRSTCTIKCDIMWTDLAEPTVRVTVWIICLVIGANSWSIQTNFPDGRLML